MILTAGRPSVKDRVLAVLDDQPQTAAAIAAVLNESRPLKAHSYPHTCSRVLPALNQLRAEGNALRFVTGDRQPTASWIRA